MVCLADERIEKIRKYRREYMRRWNAAHRDQINTKQRAKYASDPTMRVRTVARNRKRWLLNSDQVREYNNHWSREHPEVKRTAERRRYAADPVKAKAKRDKWRRANPERVKELARLSRIRNRAACRAMCMKRHASKLHRTPQWADLRAISAFYAHCPDGFHVDHVIPLRGKTVSGLHVLANLQYLPAAENLMKGNHFRGDA